MNNVSVDFSERKLDITTKILRELKVGEVYLHDHTSYKTPFSVWIATRRSRLDMNFKHSRFDGDKELPKNWHIITLQN